jgi:hypothetical protein
MNEPAYLFLKFQCGHHQKVSGDFALTQMFRAREMKCEKCLKKEVKERHEQLAGQRDQK